MSVEDIGRPRVVLVTGGRRGIGRAVARAFADAGDTVYVTGRDTAAPTAAAAAAETGIRAVPLDLRDVSSVEALADALPTGVDVVVNNAGGFAAAAPPAGAPLAQVADHWRANLEVNVVGAALVVAALEERLRPGGTVVSIGSIGAEDAGNPYSVAKAALAAWNAGLSQRLGPRGVTANVVAPGYVEGTDLFGGPLAEARRSALVDRTHTGRPGSPGDVAALVVFLASPGARHITGQTIHVNGGAHTTR